jgi:hypothetical protein
MAGQPNFGGATPISFDVTTQFMHAVTPGGLPDTTAPATNVINPGEMVHVHTTVVLAGNAALRAILAAALSNPAIGLKVKHHLENLHTGARLEQDGGTSFAISPTGATIISPAFTVPVTGVPGSANETPYKIVTTVQAGGPLSGIVAGFIDGPILMAVQP